MNEVFMNGKFIGEVDNSEEFVKQLRDSRRAGSLTTNLNVLLEKSLNQVIIETGRGRTRRPLIVIKDGIPTLTEKHIKQLQKDEISWNDLTQQGVIEYLDAAEEENALVAFEEKELTPEHTHLEITPLAMMGIVTTLVPFGDFNPSARLSIGSKNQKHAIGFYAANFPVRMDMDVNLLHTPQVPIVQSATHELSGYAHHPFR